jgi:hypothetical protein
MKVKSLNFNRSSGRDGAVKTAIKLKQHPTLCPLTRQNRPLFEVPLSAPVFDVGSPGFRATSFHTCQVLRPRRTVWAIAFTRDPCCLPHSQRASAPGIRIFPRLKGWPLEVPYRRFAAALTGAHGSGPTWLAAPSWYRTCTDYSLPVSRRTAKDSGHYRRAHSDQQVRALVLAEPAPFISYHRQARQGGDYGRVAPQSRRDEEGRRCQGHDLAALERQSAAIKLLSATSAIGAFSRRQMTTISSSIAPRRRRTPSSTESSCSHEHRSLLAAAFAGGNVVLGNLRARDYQMSKGVVLEV